MDRTTYNPDFDIFTNLLIWVEWLQCLIVLSKLLTLLFMSCWENKLEYLKILDWNDGKNLEFGH